MKQILTMLIVSVISMSYQTSHAQTVNWQSLKSDQKHIININTGYDNGATIGVAYGYHFNFKMPLVLDVQYSMPFGNEIFDDFKTKIGAQWNVVKSGNFRAAVAAHGVIRRFENPLASMMNFGSEFSGTAGIYKSRWFAAAEFGFDKAIVTNIKHSDIMKDYNPELQSGWYIPTAGNFFYGVQGGYSFKQNDITMKAGRTGWEDFKTTSLVPWYVQVGWGWRF